MELEPAVVKSIRQNKRAALLYRSLAAVPLIIIIVLCVLLAVWQYTYKSPLDRISGELAREHGRRLGLLFVVLFLVRLLPFVAMFIIAGRRIMTPVRNQYIAFTRRARDYDRRKFAGFLDSLEGVGIGLGARRPEAVVLELETPNAIAFTEKGKHYVGVTAELLSADLSRNARDAIMAHEMAHIMDGDTLRAPTLWRGFTGALFILAPLAVLATGVVANPAGLISGPMIYAPTLIMLIGYPLAIWMTARQYKDFRAERHHNDILADSIAAKVTGNPGGLREAIMKVREGVIASPVMPSETIGFPHMFVGPLKEWPLVRDQLVPPVSALVTRQGEYYGGFPQGLSRASYGSGKGWLGVLTRPLGLSPGRDRLPPVLPVTPAEYRAAESARRKMGPYIEWQREIIARRLDNLDLIERNKWQAFEVRAGRVITPPSKWE